MKRSHSHRSADAIKDAFSRADEDVSVTPYVSSAEIYRVFGDPNAKSDAADDDDRESRSKRRNRASANDRAKNASKNARSARANDESTPPRRERGKRNKNVGSEPGDRGDTVGLRIIGGRWRGTKLEYGGDRRVRPMKERVREAIFNLLGERPQGKHVVDLFAGTGALALEALSRGARSATALEIHFPTARVLRRNVEIVEAKDPGAAAKIEIVATDVYFWARKLAATDPNASIARSPIENLSQANLPTDVPWLVFCSPPYDFWIDREAETLDLLRVLRERAPNGSVFAVEADDRFDFDLLQVEISPKKRRSYAPAEVAVYEIVKE